MRLEAEQRSVSDGIASLHAGYYREGGRSDGISRRMTERKEDNERSEEALTPRSISTGATRGEQCVRKTNPWKFEMNA
jgi:hypothetical protein